MNRHPRLAGHPDTRLFRRILRGSSVTTLRRCLDVMSEAEGAQLIAPRCDETFAFDPDTAPTAGAGSHSVLGIGTGSGSVMNWSLKCFVQRLQVSVRLLPSSV